MLRKNFTPFPILTTARLILRQLEPDDEQAIFTLRSDNDVNKYLARKKAVTIDDARDFILKVNENISTNESLYWAITSKDSNLLVGTICLFSFSIEQEACEIGYELLTNYQNKGIMQEALEKIIDYAFNTLKVKKINAFFHKDNLGSVKLLEKFMFLDSNLFDESDPDIKNYYLSN